MRFYKKVFYICKKSKNICSFGKNLTNYFDLSIKLLFFVCIIKNIQNNTSLIFCRQIMTTARLAINRCTLQFQKLCRIDSKFQTVYSLGTKHICVIFYRCNRRKCTLSFKNIIKTNNFYLLWHIDIVFKTNFQKP